MLCFQLSSVTRIIAISNALIYAFLTGGTLLVNIRACVMTSIIAKSVLRSRTVEYKSCAKSIAIRKIPVGRAGL